MYVAVKWTKLCVSRASLSISAILSGFVLINLCFYCKRWITVALMKDMKDDQTLNFSAEGFQCSIARFRFITFQFYDPTNWCTWRPRPKSMTCHIQPILESLQYLGASRNETGALKLRQKNAPTYIRRGYFPLIFHPISNTDAHLAWHGKNEIFWYKGKRIYPGARHVCGRGSRS